MVVCFLKGRQYRPFSFWEGHRRRRQIWRARRPETTQGLFWEASDQPAACFWEGRHCRRSQGCCHLAWAPLMQRVARTLKNTAKPNKGNVRQRDETIKHKAVDNYVEGNVNVIRQILRNSDNFDGNRTEINSNEYF